MLMQQPGWIFRQGRCSGLHVCIEERIKCMLGGWVGWGCRERKRKAKGHVKKKKKKKSWEEMTPKPPGAAPPPPPSTHPSTVPPQSLGGFGEDIKRRLDERECGRWEWNGWGDGQSGSAQMWPAVKQRGSGRRSAADISGAAPPSRSHPFVTIPSAHDSGRDATAAPPVLLKWPKGMSVSAVSSTPPWGKGQLQA